MPLKVPSVVFRPHSLHTTFAMITSSIILSFLSIDLDQFGKRDQFSIDDYHKSSRD